MLDQLCPGGVKESCRRTSSMGMPVASEICAKVSLVVGWVVNWPEVSRQPVTSTPSCSSGVVSGIWISFVAL